MGQFAETGAVGYHPLIVAMDKLARHFLLTVLLLTVSTLLLAASPPQEGVAEHLSPYWGPAVAQWEPHILRYARRENLDPDLVAAIVWRESYGLADTRSVAGAIGLMQVMPQEEGYSTRPTTEELLDPDINLAVGTAVFTQILDETRGDLFAALAAYNGGWELGQTLGPRIYAQEVITYYAHAVAARNSYNDADVGSWGLVVEIQGHHEADIASSPVPGWLITSHIVGPRTSPARQVVGATVYTGMDEYGHPWRVNLWLLPN